MVERALEGQATESLPHTTTKRIRREPSDTELSFAAVYRVMYDAPKSEWRQTDLQKLLDQNCHSFLYQTVFVLSMITRPHGLSTTGPTMLRVPQTGERTHRPVKSEWRLVFSWVE